MKRNIMLLVAAAVTSFAIAHAGEIGHLDGGTMNIRDSFMPDRGLYGAAFNYDYFTDHLINDNGDKLSFVVLNTPCRAVPAGVDTGVNLYTLTPAVVWISPDRILGATYGSYIATTATDYGLAADSSAPIASPRKSSFGLGNFYSQAMWLGWEREHWDFSVTYDFYAPAVRYDTQTASPHEAGVTAESKENFALGYWTQQRARAGMAWYPMTNKATAFTIVWTYELNRGTDYFDIRPGQLFTVSWEVSQYLPLRKNRELLLELGPAGYDTCQITDSTGGNALTDAPKSHVQALGGELGLVYVPWNAFLRLHSFYEYAAASHFQGAAVGLNFGIKF